MTEARFEELEVGQSARFSKTVTEADVTPFAGITGDLNPAHVDEVAARASRFQGRVAHGMLSAAFISTVLGTRLPGPGTIYMGQTLRFTAPVRIGDTVTAEVTVRERNPSRPGGTHASRIQVLRAADGRVLFESWRIMGLGHAWSGGSEEGTFTQPGAVDATRLILDFFLERRGDGAACAGDGSEAHSGRGP